MLLVIFQLFHWRGGVVVEGDQTLADNEVGPASELVQFIELGVSQLRK